MGSQYWDDIKLVWWVLMSNWLHFMARSFCHCLELPQGECILRVASSSLWALQHKPWGLSLMMVSVCFTLFALYLLFHTNLSLLTVFLFHSLDYFKGLSNLSWAFLKPKTRKKWIVKLENKWVQNWPVDLASYNRQAPSELVFFRW